MYGAAGMIASVPTSSQAQTWILDAQGQRALCVGWIEVWERDHCHEPGSVVNSIVDSSLGVKSLFVFRAAARRA